MGYENRIKNIIKKRNTRIHSMLQECTVGAAKFNTIDIEAPNQFYKEQLEVFFEYTRPWQLKNATINVTLAE